MDFGWCVLRCVLFMPSCHHSPSPFSSVDSGLFIWIDWRRSILYCAPFVCICRESGMGFKTKRLFRFWQPIRAKIGWLEGERAGGSEWLRVSASARVKQWLRKNFRGNSIGQPSLSPCVLTWILLWAWTFMIHWIGVRLVNFIATRCGCRFFFSLIISTIGGPFSFRFSLVQFLDILQNDKFKRHSLTRTF